MTHLDLPALAKQVREQHPGVRVSVDPDPRPSSLEVRRKNLRVNVWQFGNCQARVEVRTAKLSDFALVRSVLDLVEEAGR